MKKYLVLLCLWLLSCKSYSQASFNIAIQKENNKTVANILEHQGNLYFTDIELVGGGTTRVNFYSFSANGNLRFVKILMFNEIVQVSKILQTQDNKIALFASGMQCHVATPLRNYLIKLDTNGANLNTKTFSVTSNANFLLNVCQLPDSTYYFISKNKIFKLTGNGLLTQSSSSFDSLTYIIPYDSSKFLITGKSYFYQGERGVFKINASDLSVDSFDSTEVIYKKIAKINNGYFGLDYSGIIHVMDTVFQSIANTNVSQNYSSGNQVCDFIVSNDSLYACGNNTNSATSFLLKSNSSLNTVAFIPNISPGSIPFSIATFSLNNYVLFNNEKPTYPTITHIFLSSFPKTAQYNFKENVNFVSVKVDTGYISSANTSYTLYTSRLKITAKNLGLNTLNSFYVNFTTGNPLGNCSEDLFQQLFTGLNVLPGDSITVTTNTFAMYNYAALGACALLTAPNNKQDSDMNDNRMCFGILSYINALKENPDFITPNIKVYPNPVESTLTIHLNSSQGKVKVQIRNSIGQLLKTEECEIKNNFVQLNVKDLADGVYVLSIINGNASKPAVSKRFVIAR